MLGPFYFEMKVNEMNREFVISSNLQSVGYENNVLEIEFKQGGIYRYYNVPEIVYKNLISAPSLGRFFHMNIKFSYPYHKVA